MASIDLPSLLPCSCILVCCYANHVHPGMRWGQDYTLAGVQVPIKEWRVTEREKRNKCKLKRIKSAHGLVDDYAIVYEWFTTV